MPSFASTFNAFPPTPPHININGRLETDPIYYSNGQPNFPMRYGHGAEYVDQYSLPPSYNNTKAAVPPPIQYPNGINGRRLNPLLYGVPDGVGNLVPIHSNTKLPPMDSAIPPQYRRHDTVIHQDHRQQQQQQQQQQQKQQKSQQKEEQKTVGGVAAHLDYEMDQMTDFVAEMSHGMYALYASKLALSDIDLLRSVHPGITVPPQFRKYVSQILSSTRLPSSTILLGLYYLASRMRMLSGANAYAAGSGQVYRMLTTALLLGSKFLDDNTFQNRSWSEVSNIPVAELNMMELEWLFGFEWKIHERIHSNHDGFLTWKSHWENWRAKVEARANNESRIKLAPINTNIQRRHALPKVMMSPDGPIPPQYQHNAWLTPMSSDYSPPSAPHTNPSTPDYFQSTPWPYTNPPQYTHSWIPPPHYTRGVPRSQPPSFHSSTYAQPFSPTAWPGHGSTCGCLYCSKHHEQYLPTASFGLQSVAG
ncbi:hypothetical protein FQN57_000032 [Myotisia sp. PD_48]|nr:hypothetical protein FQN57_000032 [Myotisia sp. PD_48]